METVAAVGSATTLGELVEIFGVRLLARLVGLGVLVGHFGDAGRASSDVSQIVDVKMRCGPAHLHGQDESKQQQQKFFHLNKF